MTTATEDPRAEIWGWKAIADRLRVSVRTAQRYAELEDDRLPVLKDRLGNVVAVASALDAWRARAFLPAHVFDELQKRPRDAQRRNVSRRARKPRESLEKKSA